MVPAGRAAPGAVGLLRPARGCGGEGASGPWRLALLQARRASISSSAPFRSPRKPGAAIYPPRREPLGARASSRPSSASAIELRERGIQLLVVPAPDKASISPNRLTRLGAEESRSPIEEFLAELARRGVQTVNLFSLFREARHAEPNAGPLYLARDTHWTPLGARLAADATARRIQGLDWAPTHHRDYATRRIRVERCGDILDMLQIPGLCDLYPVEEIRVR